MNRKIWINDLVKNKLANFSIFAFFAVSSVLFAITLCLTVQLTGSVSSLMTEAVTPDYLQMHAGDIDEEKIAEFANAQEDARDFQICRFLNIDSGDIYLADCSLSGSTQDNGVCVQSGRFDFLIDMNDGIPTLKRGEIGVPVCYMRQYGLNMGDSVTIGSMEFEIVCFIRDSQMNSMMSSSKRFLVCPEDYQALLDIGKEEYLIEFLLSDNANTSVFSTEYTKAGLPQNGPAITKSMVLMVNVLSDGIMIVIILFVSILALLVALLCIRFIVLTKLGQDKKEIGMMKALGISRREIRKLYFLKYAVIAAVSSAAAVCIAMVLSSPLSRQIRELYGNSQHAAIMVCMAMLGCGIVSGITLLSIWRMLKRTEKMSALQALFDISENRKKKRAIKWYLPALLIAAAGAMLMVVPLNIHSNILLPAYHACHTKTEKRQKKERALALMKKMQIDSLADREISKVSGGQLQRACICRSLINDPEILFADEPTGALSRSNAMDIMAELLRLSDEGTTILMVTHDSKVASFCDRVLYLLDGSIKGELAFSISEEQPEKEERIVSWLQQLGW